MTYLRNDVALFSRPYMNVRNLEELFRHENQACPAALSDGESLRLGTKSDLLKYALKKSYPVPNQRFLIPPA